MSESTVFDALDDYVAVPRLTGLVLSPDGSRLVAPVQTLAADKKRYVTALWEIATDGGPPRRLTRSAPGESAPAFLPNGDLLFVSSRPDPAVTDSGPDGDDAASGLWLLPAGGGEAILVVSRPGGVTGVVTATGAMTAVVSAPALAGPADDDAERRKARKDAGVAAILFDDLPVRHWDHDLGPDHNRLFVLGDASAASSPLRDLTPDAGLALEEAGVAIAADAKTVVTGWRFTVEGGREGSRIVAIDVASGEHRVIAGDAGPGATRGADGRFHDYAEPALSPDGRWVVVVNETVADLERSPTFTLERIDLDGGARSDLLPGFPLWPASPVVAPDSTAVYFVAVEDGSAPVFRVDVSSGAVTRLTGSGAYSDLSPSPDGRWVYALRTHVDSPARPVRLDARSADQDPVVLDAPGEIGPLPGRVERVETVGPDGAVIRSWLVLPADEQPAPLLLWVHGGPLMSWDGWSWRWNPWLMAAQGWAVVLPDPGLSQGYGDEFIQRAWGQWGPVPFADLMAAVDAVEARDDIDASRTAAMGGSYGGYMANWIAGHTERFQAIVTHASLWALDRFVGATDHPGSWAQEWGYPSEEPERYERNSPHLHAAAIRTPMLVVHGDKDYRVPIGEGLSLWTDLVHAGVDAKFLYFPDEGHWVLKPGQAKVWYSTVWAWLDHHVRGAEWVRPPLL